MVQLPPAVYVVLVVVAVWTAIAIASHPVTEGYRILIEWLVAAASVVLPTVSTGAVARPLNPMKTIVSPTTVTQVIVPVMLAETVALGVK